MENMRTHGSPSKPVSVVVVPRAHVPLLFRIALLILLILLLGWGFASSFLAICLLVEMVAKLEGADVDLCP